MARQYLGQQIVLAWCDMSGLKKTGRVIWRDSNYFDEWVGAPAPKAAMWIRDARPGDLEKAEAYARADNRLVMIIPASEKDPLGLAKQKIMELAAKGQRVCE